MQKRLPERSTDRNALLMDARTELERRSSGMGQRSNYASQKVAQIVSSKEECEKTGGAVKDVQCTNEVIKEGVLCSSEGCRNLTQKGGVCSRHGARSTV